MEEKEVPDPDIPEEDEEPSRIMKLLLAIGAIMLILLMLSYFIAGPYTIDIIGSMLTSSKMDHLSVHGDGFVVMFEKPAYDELKSIYLETQDKEFKACLKGDYENEMYWVREIFFPEQRGTFNQVIYSECPSDTIVSLHSHPYKHCRASEQDFRSFEEFRKTSPDAVMIIMCELDRFYVYR
ncbi:MAG: hypothetical protein KKE20_04380 [Nanoarchaeota archaeon]|nr:hypothetical protein [Nanoarchaeota archaeon]